MIYICALATNTSTMYAGWRTKHWMWIFSPLHVEIDKLRHSAAKYHQCASVWQLDLTDPLSDTLLNQCVNVCGVDFVLLPVRSDSQDPTVRLASDSFVNMIKWLFES